MLKILRNKKSQYRGQVGNIGKLLVMEPPAPDPLAVLPENFPPHLVNVGVQYDDLDTSTTSSSSSSVFAVPSQSQMEDLGPTEEYDMADGLVKSPPSLASSDSLDSSSKKTDGDRISVDLADLSSNGPMVARGLSEASDSGFSNEKDSEIILERHPVVELEPVPLPMEPVPDEGVETDDNDNSQIEMNGSSEPPPTPSDLQSVDFPDERRDSRTSLNDSISSSLSSAENGTTKNHTPKPAEPQEAKTKPRRGKNRYANVAPRIDNGRQSGKQNSDRQCKENNEEVFLSTEGKSPEIRPEPEKSKKRVHFQNPEEEEEFIIHHGPGYDEVNGVPEASKPSNFSEPRSLVKQYIRGRAGGCRRPRIVKQTTVEVAELARKPQRAIPIPQASASGTAPNIPVKQTIASKKRTEKLQQESQAQLDRLQAESAYMTPLQRKELEVKELRRQLGDAYYLIEQREVELDVFHHEKQREIQDVVEEKDEMLKEMEENVEILQDEMEALKAENGALSDSQVNLDQTIRDLKEEAQKRELRHQALYLQMYRKGRDSALFERQDELEKLALEDPDKVSKDELLQKLSTIQSELEHWQTVKLTEHYDEAARPETEADAKLKFLKDSMFHYLTEMRKEPVEQHLNAIVQIFQFTDVQMKSINKSMEEKRRRGRI